MKSAISILVSSYTRKEADLLLRHIQRLLIFLEMSEDIQDHLVPVPTNNKLHTIRRNYVELILEIWFGMFYAVLEDVNDHTRNGYKSFGISAVEYRRLGRYRNTIFHVTRHRKQFNRCIRNFNHTIDRRNLEDKEHFIMVLHNEVMPFIKTLMMRFPSLKRRYQLVLPLGMNRIDSC